MLWLMSAYALVEDLMQGVVRRVVRVARKAPDGHWGHTFQEQRNAIVAVFVMAAVVFVYRHAHKPPKRNTNKTKQR